MKFIFTLLSFSALKLFAQQIQGNFKSLEKKSIQLVGFSGKDFYTIDSTKVSEQGNFTLHYSNKDHGMGYIICSDNKPFMLVLENNNVELKGEDLSISESVTILKGAENKVFVSYANEHAKREQALSAWSYLKKIYESDPQFSNKKIERQFIVSEMNAIRNQDKLFLEKLPKSSYISWYLPIRKLISDVSDIVQFRTSEIPATVNAFRKINYTDPRLYKSGLLNDLFESHYWLLENSRLSKDSMFTEMNRSTDAILGSLINNDSLYNQITNLLFDYFEKHSLLMCSEYIAAKALTQNKIVLTNKLSNKLESYRAMKVGNIAPDFIFEGLIYESGFETKKLTRLSDIPSKYKLVIFGASWCPACSNEMAQLLPQYQKWKAKGVEVVFVSLDTDKTDFTSYVKDFPFISMCDFNKWDSKSAKDYYIFSSPTIFLLDKNNKIVARPSSINSLSQIINFYPYVK